MTKRKICVVTGSRAEYGLLRCLMGDIRDNPRLELQVIATGMHLAPEFGSTYQEIEQDGFAIDEKIDLLLTDDSPTAITNSVGRGIIGFADVIQRRQPDLMVVLGDRYEIFAAAQASMLARIPIAHIHGGELTEGAIDDSIRHALTKMAHLHFVAAEPYRKRVVQLGESPDRVFTVGAPGVDNVKRITPICQSELERDIGLKFSRPSFLVTYHPETLSEKCASNGIGALLEALEEFDDSRIVMTGSNADHGGRAIMHAISNYAEARSDRVVVHASLGQQRYLSVLRYVDAVIGNSSSGIIEAPALGVPTVNIGDRQKGRLRSSSIIDCAPETLKISNAIRCALSSEFRQIAKTTTPAYGAGNAAQKICQVLATFPLDRLARKQFYDLT